MEVSEEKASFSRGKILRGRYYYGLTSISILFYFSSIFLLFILSIYERVI